MTLIQLAYLIYQVIAGQLSLQAAIAKVLSYAEHAAQETAPLALQTIAANGTNVVINPSYGNSALRDILLDRFADVDAAIAAITPTPPAPPPTAGENAEAVWTYVLANATPSGPTADQALAWAGQHAANVSSQGGYRFARAGDFLVEFPWADEWGLYHNYGWEPTPDYSEILPSDTVLTWLNRTDTRYPALWQQDTPNAPCYVYPPGPGARPVRVWCLLRTDELVGRLAGAPVWPGLDRVTLGAPVAIAADVTIPGPLDGVLVAITTPPTGLGQFEVGGETWWYRAGQLAFVSDRGDVEPWQYITWTHALYCPRQQTRADHAIVRGLAGIGGTVTPWLTT